MFSSSRVFGLPLSPAGEAKLRLSADSQKKPSLFSTPTGGATAKRRTDQSFEPPCIPVTCKVLFDAVHQGNLEAGKSVIYEDVQCGVISIVGWVTSISLDAIEPEFELADGTSTSPICAIVDTRSENENWLRPKLTDAVHVGARLRVIAQAYAVGGLPRLRALHVRSCTAADWAYYHTIETAHTFLTATSRTKNNTEAIRSVSESTDLHTSGYHDSEEIEAPLANLSLRSPRIDASTNGTPKIVELPPCFSDVNDSCQRHILRYILDERRKDVGCSAKEIKTSLASQFTASQISESLEELDNSGNLFQTVAGHVDCLSLDADN